MTPPDPSPPRDLEQRTFLLLLVVITIAFAFVLWPFYGAVFWGAVLALLFQPLFRRLLRRFGRRRTPAALATLAVILVLVILPVAFIAASLLQETAAVYKKIQSGEMNFARYFDQILAVAPSWATGLLDRFGLNDMADVQAKLTAGLAQRGQAFAASAVDIGQNALDFVVGFCLSMYLLFFLLRDGAELANRVKAAIPLEPQHKTRLLSKFTTVIRATVKGNILVAAAQGALGGLAFWALGVHGAVLWAVIMAFLSLLPAIGAALIWAPVALYLLATGVVWKGVALIVWGVVVIGLIDNVLRPILVGKDTKMPDYLVLISTLGGLALFGLNGFVIGPVIAAMFISVWDIFAAGRAEARANARIEADT
ncbi:MAG: AI-2E family transporter [Caldimonas sp.]